MELKALEQESAAVFAKPESPETWEAMDALIVKWEAYMSSVAPIEGAAERSALLAAAKANQPTILASVRAL